MDCYTKVVILLVIFRGERNKVNNGLISMITIGKLMRKGCEVFLALFENTFKIEKKLEYFLVVEEYSNVFPKEFK